MHVTQHAWNLWRDDPSSLLPALSASTPVHPPFPATPDFTYSYHPGLGLYFVVAVKYAILRLVTIIAAPPPTFTLPQATDAVSRTLAPRPDFPTFARERAYLQDLRDHLLACRYPHLPHTPLYIAYSSLISRLKSEIAALRDHVRKERHANA